ncbi:MAG: ankyrin repeat domain-containing protein [Bacteroidetes bacterium]|nr:ankyrin repeat domain-containing protein [Bacteroidota bacterium]
MNENNWRYNVKIQFIMSMIITNKNHKKISLREAIYDPENLQRFIKNNRTSTLNKSQINPIILATILNLERSVEILLQNNQDPNATTKENYTALHIATNFNYPKIIEILLKSGADPDHQKNEYKASPLHIACSKNRLEIARLLIKYGAYLNTVNILEDTPLHEAVEKENLEIIRELIKNGANTNKINNNNHKPVYYLKSKNIEIKKLLQ